jgi:hypothetical protein
VSRSSSDIGRAGADAVEASAEEEEREKNEEIPRMVKTATATVARAVRVFWHGGAPLRSAARRAGTIRSPLQRSTFLFILRISSLLSYSFSESLLFVLPPKKKAGRACDRLRRVHGEPRGT